jgi:hypothetical protein
LEELRGACLGRRGLQMSNAPLDERHAFLEDEIELL